MTKERDIQVVRIPLAGSLINRDTSGTLSFDQEFVNCFPNVITNSVVKNSIITLKKRPGYQQGGALTSVTAATQSGAIFSATGDVSSVLPTYTAFKEGSTTASIWNMNTDTQLGGDISGVTECVFLGEHRISDTWYAFANLYDSTSGGLEQWTISVTDAGATGAWTQVTDADFPSGVRGIVGFPAFMDGYVFNMDFHGKIWNSDLNSVSAYSATSFINAGAEPDLGVTVAKYKNYIVGFNRKSIEFFYNAGNATGSPLSRTPDGHLLMGAKPRFDVGSGGGGITSNPQTVLPAFDTIYWIGTSGNNGTVTGIYRFLGDRQPEKISTTEVDRALLSPEIIGFAGTMTMYGMSHIVMLGDTSHDRNWCYCIDTNTWWRLELASGHITAIATGIDELAGAGANATTNRFIGTNNTRNNEFLTSLNRDNGSDYTATIKTWPIDFGTNQRKFWTRLSIIGDVHSSAGTVGVQYSDDGGSTFSTARNIDMTTSNTSIYNLGSSRRRIWKLTNTQNGPLRLEALELEYKLGIH